MVNRVHKKDAEFPSSPKFVLQINPQDWLLLISLLPFANYEVYDLLAREDERHDVYILSAIYLIFFHQNNVFASVDQILNNWNFENETLTAGVPLQTDLEHNYHWL